MKKILLLSILVILFSIRTRATVHTIIVGNYSSLYNLCVGDTLRFIGDSTNTFYYGVIQGYVRNSITQLDDNFTITSYTNIATTYDHILVAGDDFYFYHGMPPDVQYGGLYYNCITSVNSKWNYASQIYVKVLNVSRDLTVFEFDVPSHDLIELCIYDLNGSMVKKASSLIGHNRIVFDNHSLSVGLYFYSISTRDLYLASGKFAILN